MAQTVVGLFDQFDDAQSAVNELESAGFTRDAISIVANDASGEHTKQHGGGDAKMDNNAAEKAGSGAVAGTATGAGIGLLVGLGALAIPGIGPILAAGPLAAALGIGGATVAGATALGAGLGAASGALTGPLVDAGIPRPEAEMYNEGVRRGGTLVTVRTNDRQDAEEAADIMARYDVVDIDQRGESYRNSGWKYDDAAKPYTTDEVKTYRSSYATERPIVGATTDTTRTMATADTTTNRQNIDGEQVLPVIEENLQVDKRQVQGGTTRIRTFITERPIEEQVTLRDETIRVQRRAAQRDVAPGELDAFREQTFEVTETSEEAVVAKTARVIEEVVVGKDVQQRTETIRDTVRRQDVDVQESSSEQRVGTTKVADFTSFDTDFRSNYDTNYKNSGMTYENYTPVYRYGYNLASDDRYSNADWNTVENDARTHWEEKNPGTWEQFKDGIHYAWERARGKR